MNTITDTAKMKCMAGTIETSLVVTSQMHDSVNGKLQGLGLHHTHKDSTPIKEATRKYVYSNGNVNITNSTDNIMSYGNKIKKSLWRWQWHIINPNIKEK